MDMKLLRYAASELNHCIISVDFNAGSPQNSHMQMPVYAIFTWKYRWFYFLARSANLPEGLYIFLALISSSFFAMSKAISVSTGPIFTIFSPNGRYLREFSRSCQFLRFLRGRCHGNHFVSQAKYKSCAFCATFISYESVLGVDDRCEFFLIPQGTLPWQTILCYTGLVCLEPKYLRVCWTDSHYLCTANAIMVDTELHVLRDVAMATN